VSGRKKGNDTKKPVRGQSVNAVKNPAAATIEARAAAPKYCQLSPCKKKRRISNATIT